MVDRDPYPWFSLASQILDLQNRVYWLERTNMAGKTSDRIMQYFDYIAPDNVRQNQLDQVHLQFKILAEHVVELITENPEKTVALRKILEAKEAAVRAVLYKEPEAR